MGRYFITFLLLFCSFSFMLSAQEDEDTSAAFQYKVDYEVPESPAFSILDANPTSVMRGSAAQELVIHFANSIIGNQKINAGVAADFNPYFVFGGRLHSIDQYRENYFKRLLANAQLSIATTTLTGYPDDIFGSGGLRLTLYDSKDLLFNDDLGNRIDDALIPEEVDDPFGDTLDQVGENEKLKQAYEKVKEELRNKKGGAVSMGFATSARLRSGLVQADSIQGYKNQVWLSGQYCFGKGINLMGMIMYRNDLMAKMHEFRSGLALRYVGKKTNISGEMVYSSEQSFIGIGMNIEVRVLSQIILYANVGNNSNENPKDGSIHIKPGIKWCLAK